ncbi:hypothetical protein BC939DRAFT_450323 [Gamsiella multidivaricata]|uniref:uncharacterized protein n=1 Tax=Gamsiella multidivaricata TaxID=101098 RepID=UPI00221EDC89|nr:uncharacterized protein BC939DRAFT_450323 [Gamsiella multidivaricata]KAI7824426.1 hypothetical protein BC939DRAFT_450323 [Gamsiella multidivaricata]
MRWEWYGLLFLDIMASMTLQKAISCSEEATFACSSLSFATMIHKFYSLTLPQICVSIKGFFCPGLPCVALSGDRTCLSASCVLVGHDFLWIVSFVTQSAFAEPRKSRPDPNVPMYVAIPTCRYQQSGNIWRSARSPWIRSKRQWHLERSLGHLQW